MARIDVVVVSYRTSEEVRRISRDLRSMTCHDYELHVFDNAGNSKTLTIAWNDLASAGTGDYIAFLNPDVAVSPEWGVRLVRYLEDHSDIGAILPIAFGHERPIRHFMGPLIEGNWPNPPSPHDMVEIANRYSPIQGHYVYGPQDCCAFYSVLIRRKTWLELKGFDERFTLYGQDHDFQDRLRKSRLNTATLLSVPFWHGGSLSTKRACEHGEVNLNEEYARIGQVLRPLRTGRLMPWHELSDDQRKAVRQNPRYNRIARY